MPVNPEYQYQAAFFLIEAQTNLHAGSGSESYGIIDNLVQRDSSTGFPCINASSLKGALKEFFRHYLKDTERSAVTYMFGNEKNPDEQEEDDEGGKQKNTPGRYRFMQADLLCLPLRSDRLPFYRATCRGQLALLNDQMALFGRKSKELSELKAEKMLDTAITLDANGLSQPVRHVEGAELTLGNNAILLANADMAEAVSDFNLPVLARNHLNDGQSANLWYEQVLPRFTRLVFHVLYPSGPGNHFDLFKRTVTAAPVQIGANASVGYGFCRITELPLQPLVPHP